MPIAVQFMGSFVGESIDTFLLFEIADQEMKSIPLQIDRIKVIFDDSQDFNLAFDQIPSTLVGGLRVLLHFRNQTSNSSQPIGGREPARLIERGETEFLQ